ncbi:MAG: class I SAM-dependent methyltransferase [Firmicutes bacterium]|jgi:SAM-dependent methyltransferase|nr:class I SAM-dependent methyltransferase [Bacillota bacterium]
MDSLYANPFYYEIAFSYRDIPKEVQVMQEVIRRYSPIPVKRVLELGCGNSPHMLELLQRGYSYVGLDLSPEMLQYSREKAQQLGQSIELYRQNMNDFQLDTPVDFAFIMLGSLYVKNTSELISHFASVNRALNPGGLYFLDWCVDFSWLADTTDSWIMERDGIIVEVSHSTELINYIDQTFRERITLLVNDRGQVRHLQQDSIRRAIYPQEFLLITDQQGFEFIGWWNNWNLNRPLAGTEEQVVRPISVLRKR